MVLIVLFLIICASGQDTAIIWKLVSTGIKIILLLVCILVIPAVVGEVTGGREIKWFDRLLLDACCIVGLSAFEFIPFNLFSKDAQPDAIVAYEIVAIAFFYAGRSTRRWA
ncbi:hypothetical protein HY086_03110 [Candidatus Gottesmanbacteria bacterium]|nr:hypothetical protein [Candidatus Gottesmanbacteria bacterium]